MSTIHPSIESPTVSVLPPSNPSPNEADKAAAMTVSADSLTNGNESPQTPPTISVTATILLSPNGRRASLLAGGDGRRLQRRTVQISAQDIELVRVNRRGEATLMLTPQIVATPDGQLRRTRQVPEYDTVPSEEQVLADARALGALRQAYDAQRDAARMATKEAFAQQFLQDPSLRALAHPPPTALRCVCRADRGLLIFHTTDAGAAALVPVEAHRRFRADLADRARAARAQLEREAAIHQAKRECMTRWIAEHGSPEQRGAGLTVRALEDALAAELETDRVRWEAASAEVQRRRIEGHDLVENKGADMEFSHFLNGESLHPGSRLYLLTDAGWIRGRYETGVAGDPRFYFVLPGAGHYEVGVPILHGCRVTRRFPADVRVIRLLEH